MDENIKAYLDGSENGTSNLTLSETNAEKLEHARDVYLRSSSTKMIELSWGDKEIEFDDEVKKIETL